MEVNEATKRVHAAWAGARSGIRIPPDCWIDIYLSIPAARVAGFEMLHIMLHRDAAAVRKLLGCTQSYYDGLLIALDYAIRHAQIIPSIYCSQNSKAPS